MKIILALFFSWTVWDRLASMFCTKKEARQVVSIFERLNSVLMIFLYAGIALYGFFSMLFIPQMNGIMSLIGMILYMCSRLLRNAAIRTMRRQWNIYTSAEPIGEILKVGPFRYSRHPYYVATLGELFGYAFLFNSAYSGVAAAVIFLPLLFWIRIAAEEKGLLRRFPLEYQQYQSEVGIFFRR